MGKLTGFMLGLLAVLIIAISDIINEVAHKWQRRLWEKRKGN